MRIIFASMPLIALVAILAANVNERLQVESTKNGDKIAMAETLDVMRHSKSEMMRRLVREQIVRAAQPEPQHDYSRPLKTGSTELYESL